MFALHDVAAKLELGSVCFDVKWKVGVRIVEKHVFSNHGFDGLEGSGTRGSPLATELWRSNFRQRGKRSKNMGSAGPHITVEVDHTNECAKLSERARFSESKDAVNLLCPRFDASRCDPMSEPVSLTYSPFAFCRIDSVAIRLEQGEDGTDGDNVFCPRVGEDANIINVAFNRSVEKVGEDIFEAFLCPVRRLGTAHRETETTEFAKGGDEDTEPGGGFVKFVCVEAEGQVDLGEVLVAATTMKNILDARKHVFLAADLFVKFAEVVDSADGTIFLGDDKEWHAPFSRATFCQDADVTLALEFSFEDRKIDQRNRIRAFAMVRNCIRFEIDVKFAMRESAELASEKDRKRVEDFKELFALIWSEMRLSICDSARVGKGSLGFCDRSCMRLSHGNTSRIHSENLADGVIVAEIVFGMEWDDIIKPFASEVRTADVNLDLVKEATSKDDVVFDIGSIEEVSLDATDTASVGEFWKA